MLAYLAHHTGHVAVAGKTMMRADAHYGNALLTRLPPTAVRHHDLSVPGREPRGALDVDLISGDCKIQLIATHLGLHPAERRYQIRRLLPLFDFENYDLVLLVGDFNEWFLWGRALRIQNRVFPDTPPPPLLGGAHANTCTRPYLGVPAQCVMQVNDAQKRAYARRLRPSATERRNSDEVRVAIILRLLGA